MPLPCFVFAFTHSCAVWSILCIFTLPCKNSLLMFFAHFLSVVTQGHWHPHYNWLVLVLINENNTTHSEILIRRKCIRTQQRGQVIIQCLIRKRIITVIFLPGWPTWPMVKPPSKTPAFLCRCYQWLVVMVLSEITLFQSRFLILLPPPTNKTLAKC